jgi:hypothetical protein
VLECDERRPCQDMATGQPKARPERSQLAHGLAAVADYGHRRRPIASRP